MVLLDGFKGAFYHDTGNSKNPLGKKLKICHLITDYDGHQATDDQMIVTIFFTIAYCIGSIFVYQT